MTIVNVERLKKYGTYLGHFESVGYLYKIDNTLYSYSKHGMKKL